MILRRAVKEVCPQEETWKIRKEKTFQLVRNRASQVIHLEDLAAIWVLWPDLYRN
jgi:hypothetical protein